ncbi:MAG: chromate transporter [Prevotellaceae bacterium]|jgi:chromate transporter|nr:chromate transporter [Prevotellaceae bacterium]
MLYFQLFYSFLKIGAFTFGGGYSMISLIENEVVNKRKWLDKEIFLDYLVLAQTAPGILAINISILVGNALKGKRGAVVATLGTALPSFVFILLIATFLAHNKESALMLKIFKAVRPVVVALIVVPVFNLAKTAKVTWKTAVVPIVVVLLIWQFGISPIYIIIFAIFVAIMVKMLAVSNEKRN